MAGREAKRVSGQEAWRDEGGGNRANKRSGRRVSKGEKGEEKEKENPGKSLRKGPPLRDWGERGPRGAATGA